MYINSRKLWLLHTFRKRKAEQEANEEEAKKKEVEWKKNFEVRIFILALKGSCVKGGWYSQQITR